MKIFGKTAAETGAVHFIGIGGIGMSGLAEILALGGFSVQGSDMSAGYTDERLRAVGVVISIGHAAEQLGNARLVVTSSAIMADNPELIEAHKRGVKIVHRADILAQIMENYQTVAVSGTHGKTSTTALIYTALKAAGLPVGVINGGVLNAEGTNAIKPPKLGDWLVVEADESDASFLKLKPTVAVITNIEPEHMDTYGTEEKLVQAFVDFASNSGAAIVCGTDLNGAVVAAQADPKDVEPITYGIDVNSDEGLDAYVTMFAPQGRAMAFDCVLRGGVLDDVVVNLPGEHYVANALAALVVAQLLRVDVNKAAEGLAGFKGVGRRFSYLGRLNGESNGPEIIDDYGHHPTEIAATLAAAKGTTTGKVVAVIQPHRYTRLRDLMDEFASCARGADAVILLPVHSAGEAPIAGVSSGALAEKMTPKPFVAEDEDSLRAALDGMNLGKTDAVLCLGAGSISKMAHHLVENH